MELKWLEDFLSLARTKSFSRSAEERNITQSALSRRIQALERWLGAPLVDRSTFPSRLTREGEAFREAAEDAVRHLMRARDDARATRRRAENMILFSATHSIAVSFFPQWLKRMETLVGPIHAQMVADNMHNCVQNLAEGVCDFLICFSHPGFPLLIDADRFPSRHLADDRLLPVSTATPEGLPLFALPGTAQQPLPYLGYAADSFFGRVVDELLARPDRRCHLLRRYQDSLASALTAMAHAGHGLAWVPESLVAEDLASGRLCPAGGSEWEVPFGISIYRTSERSRPRVDAIWARLPELHTG
ncbi:MAG: LysR family transcriptional regulator [Rubrivivax sp.]|nr:LysR family transcriptional regulator [Rubrivivax sp.]